MEQMFSEAIQRVPALSVLVGVVWIFIRYIGNRDEQIESAFSRRDAMFIEAHREMILAMKEIEKSCEQTGIAALSALDRNTHALNRIDDRMNNKKD